MEKHLPLDGGPVKKTKYFPLTPSPARGESKYIEIGKKFPPPRRGRGRVEVGVVNGLSLF
jgi:hypothetical protein